MVAGPWVGGVGMELMYWIPLLTWLTTEGGVDPARVVAISRGGADDWYSGVARTYLDLFDHYSPGVVRAWHEEHLRYPDTETHIAMHGYDRETFDLVRDRIGERKVEWLHPMMMHRLFAPRWEWGAPGTVVSKRTEQRPLPAGEEGGPDLPDSYLAVKPYFNSSFPATDENHEAFERIVTTLAEQTPVVLVRGVEEAGGHTAFVPSPGLPVLDVSENVDPRRNLAVQTRIIRQARALIVPYGGFSFIGPYVDTPTLAIYSTPRLTTVHLDTIERVARNLSGGKRRLYRARHIGTLQAVSDRE